METRTKIRNRALSRRPNTYFAGSCRLKLTPPVVIIITATTTPSL